MKKRVLTFLSAILLTGVLASCGPDNKDNSTTGGNNPISTGTSNTPVDEEYVIRVTAPSGVTYSLSKEKAKAGESVTLTITFLPSGFTVQNVTMNSTTLEADLGSNGSAYTFVMPNRSVTINITCAVDGEVTLIGDIVGVLEKEGDIYVLRDVKVEKAGLNYFSYQVKGETGSPYVLSSMDLDEHRCFADISSTYKSSYNLEIMGGNTYDFYYDPSAYRPCYVIRTEVNSLPNSVTSLYTLFDGMAKSESTVNYPDLTRIQYSTINKENIDDLKMIDYDMKIYEDNTSYAVVNNTLESKTYHVYKHLNDETGLFEIVDTYPVNKGNDDRFRYEYNNYGAYSGRWDVVDTTTAEISRAEVRERDALVNINHGAHYGYYLERDFMDAYRVGFSMDEMSSYRINISSSKDTENGDFTTTIDSYVEYNSSAGTYTSEMHEAYIFKATLLFDKAGRLKELSYQKTKFTQSSWDFSAHAPLAGQEGTLNKTITATYSYGEPFAKSELSFDTTPYFVSSVDSVRFYDSKTGMPSTDTNSYLHYSDKVSLNPLYESGYAYLDQFVYTPATSLDVWQYGPVASSNESVIKQEASDLWYCMSCVGIGSSTVTFANHTKSSGISFDVTINVNATQKFHAVSLYSTWGGLPGDVTSATSANVVAGTIQSYKVSVTPSSAPVIYTAVSENPELLKIVETGVKLTIDTTGAANITTPTVVRVRIDSDWFNESMTNPYVMFSFTIIPMALNPIGTTWGCEGLEEHVNIQFTNVEDSSSTEDQKVYKGVITDDGYVDETTSLGLFRAEFIYTYVNGAVNARVTSVYFENNTDGWSTDPYDYSIDFYYEADTNRFGLYLAEIYYDSDYEGLVYSPIFGECDGDGIPTSYTPFTKIN